MELVYLAANNFPILRVLLECNNARQTDAKTSEFRNKKIFAKNQRM